MSPNYKETVVYQKWKNGHSIHLTVKDARDFKEKVWDVPESGSHIARVSYEQFEELMKNDKGLFKSNIYDFDGLELAAEIN